MNFASSALRGAVALALSIAFGLPVCAAAAKKNAKPAAAPEPAEIELAHQLPADKAEQLQKLVERFNAQNTKGPRIVLSARAWDEGTLPTLLLLEGVQEERFLARPNRYKAVWELMKDAGQPLDTLKKAPAQMIPTPLDAKGRLLALPVGLSTPITYFNKSALTKAGVDVEHPPATWRGWQELLGKLYDQGVRCPYTTVDPVGVFVENTSAWHNQPMVASGGKASYLAINGLMQVKHLAMMASWHKARYLHLFGQDSEAETQFLTGACAVMTAPSSAYATYARQAGFELGIATLPYHEDAYGAPQNTLADGPALWVAAGRGKGEYQTVARFLRYWLTPESQIEWQVATGYLPLNRAGLLAATDSSLLRNELAPQRLAISQLTHKPVTSASSATQLAHRAGVRQAIAQELDALWADRKPAKQALDDAVAKIQNVDCCARLLGLN